MLLHDGAFLAQGSPIDKYEVLYKTPAQTSPPTAVASPNAAASAEVTGLAPSTMYQLRVRAHSAGGWGLLSSPVTATTAAPLHAPPIVTSTPTVAAAADHAANMPFVSTCDAVVLAMPSLRPGCSGDEAHRLQWREARWASMSESAGWQNWVNPQPTSSAPASNRLVPAPGLARLAGLDPATAYQVCAQTVRPLLSPPSMHVSHLITLMGIACLSHPYICTGACHCGQRARRVASWAELTPFPCGVCWARGHAACTVGNGGGSCPHRYRLAHRRLGVPTGAAVGGADPAANG